MHAALPSTNVSEWSNVILRLIALRRKVGPRMGELVRARLLVGHTRGTDSVLFSPTDPANRLFPPQWVLDDVLALLNSDGLKDISAEDETIGWLGVGRWPRLGFGRARERQHYVDIPACGRG